jgi:hypothetical protein
VLHHRLHNLVGSLTVPGYLRRIEFDMRQFIRDFNDAKFRVYPGLILQFAYKLSI